MTWDRNSNISLITYETSTSTKHDCGGPVFGKLTPDCPRCDELLKLLKV